MHPICLHIHQINYIHSSLFPAWSKAVLFSKLIMWSKNCVQWTDHFCSLIFRPPTVCSLPVWCISMFIYLSISMPTCRYRLPIYIGLRLLPSTSVYLSIYTYLPNKNIYVYIYTAFHPSSLTFHLLFSLYAWSIHFQISKTLKRLCPAKIQSL